MSSPRRSLGPPGIHEPTGRFRFRERTGAREFDRGVHLGPRGLVELADRVVVEPAVPARLVAQPRNRVESLPLGIGGCVAVALLVALVVAAAAVGQALEQHRATALASGREELAERP